MRIPRRRIGRVAPVPADKTTTLSGRALLILGRHYAEMILAMVAGMIILGMAESALFGAGWAELNARPEPKALIMAANMSIPMIALMRIRRHGWKACAQMTAVMFLAFVVLFPLLWLGALSSSGLIVAGHVVMFTAMACLMVLQRNEYIHLHQTTGPR